MAAYLKGVKQYNLGKTERNLEIAARYSDQDLETLRVAAWPAIHANGQVNLKSLMDFQEWALKEGALDSIIKEEEFWDPRFLEMAAAYMKDGKEEPHGD